MKREWHDVESRQNVIVQVQTGGRRGGDIRRGIQQPYVELPSAAQAAERARLAAARSKAVTARDLAELTTKVAPRGFAAACGELNKRAKAALDAVGKEQNALTMQVPAAMVMKERAEVRPTHVFLRGQYDTPGALVTRGTPAFLPDMAAEGPTPSRMDLADWLLAPQHPLTARVAVNRFWQQLFGVGLVETSEDFGTQGAAPSSAGRCATSPSRAPTGRARRRLPRPSSPIRTTACWRAARASAWTRR